MQEYFSLLTTTGANLLINAVANKTPVKLSKIAVSDSEIAPSEAATELENTKHEFAINSLTQDPQNSSILNIEGVIPSSVGGFNIRKFAIFTQSGEMFAVGRVPLSYKPALNQGAGSDVVFKIRILVGNVSNIELKVDNSVVLATRDWAEKTFLKLTDKIDAYTKTQADDKFALKSDITDGVKIGSYLLWSSQSVTPAGFLTCDGRSLKKSEYAELFAVIGYTYGGSGESFNIPKFNDGRFMRSTGGAANSLGVLQEATKIPNIGIYRNTAGNQAFLMTPSVNSYGPDVQLQISNADSTNQSTAGGYFNWTTSNIGGSTSLGTHSTVRPENSSVVVLIKAKDVKEATASEVDKTPYATETKAGIVKLKNSITGNSEDTAVSEKAVKEFASGVFQKQESGYQKLPSGLIFQWGSYPTITAGQSKDVNLPVAFPTAGVFCSANDSSDAGNLAVMLCKFKSNSQITITNDNSANTGNRNVSGQWFAVGY